MLPRGISVVDVSHHPVGHRSFTSPRQPGEGSLPRPTLRLRLRLVQLGDAGDDARHFIVIERRPAAHAIP